MWGILQKLFALALILGTAESVFAHPTTFKDSLVIESSNSPLLTRFHSNYSFLHWFATGVTYRRFDGRFGVTEIVSPQINFLVHRWNLPAAQANIYLEAGGGAYFQNGTDGGIGTLTIQGDYETREIYTALRASSYYSNDSTNFNEVTLKAGLAPYVGGFDDLHIWMIAHLGYRDFLRQGDRFHAGPMLRFFFKNVFWEFGGSYQGYLFVNTMVHF